MSGDKFRCLSCRDTGWLDESTRCTHCNITADLFGTDPHKLARTDAPGTSKAAARSVNTTEKEQRVYDIVVEFGPAGCILDDVRRVYFKRYGFSAAAVSTVSARFKGLEDKGLIYYPGEERKGETGRMQRVRIATKFRNQVAS